MKRIHTMTVLLFNARFETNPMIGGHYRK